MANCVKCVLWEFDIRAIVFEQGVCAHRGLTFLSEEQ